jgi:subtilisin family serine protease
MDLRSIALSLFLAPSLSFAGGAAPYKAPFMSQWAFENKGQEVCRFDGKNCLKGTPGADIKAKQAWAKNQDCSSVVVAVLDSGVDSRHPDLSANLLRGYNFVDETNDPTDDNLHGTHVSGIIAAAGSETKGVVGVCKKAKVLPVKVGSAEGYLTDEDVLQGIGYAVSQGAKVVNGSFGGGPGNELIKKAIAKASGTLFIFAAGNGDMFGRGFDVDAKPVYPAAYGLDNIVAVAATNSQDKLGSFSNWGLNTVDLAAPGVNIVSTFPMKQTEEMRRNKIPAELGALDGTSMATPYVTGAVALLWSTSPKASLASVKQRLLASVDKVPSLNGKVKTGGRLNLSKLFFSN